MVQKIPGKVSRSSESCQISEMPTIQPKILETPGAKLNGKKISGEKISKIWVYLARLFGNFNFGKWFWLNGKRPCFDSIVRSVIGWKISRHFSQPIKIETWTKRDLITSFFPRLASDANLYFEISLVLHWFIFFYFLTLNNRFILHRKLSLVHKNRL